MNYKMQSGEFKHPIVIEKLVQTTSEDDILVNTYEPILKTKAKILNVKADDVIQIMGEGVKKVSKFYIRFSKTVDITESDYITYKGLKYNIKSVNNIQEANKYLEILGEYNGI